VNIVVQGNWRRYFFAPWALGCVGCLIVAGTIAMVYVVFLQPESNTEINMSSSTSMVRTDPSSDVSKATRAKIFQGRNLDANQELKDIANVNSAFRRTQLLFELLTVIDSQFIGQLLSESTSISSVSTRRQFQEIITRKFATVDPRHAVSEIVKLPENDQDGLIRVLFQEWSTSNLDDAVSFAIELDDSMKRDALRGIVEFRNDLSEREHLDISIRLDNPRLGVSMIVESWEDQGKKISEPEFVWNFLLEQSSSDGKPVSAWEQHLLRKIATAWLDKSGIEVLTKISESIPNESDRISVISSVLSHLAVRNPQQAFDSALRFTDSDLSIAGRTVRTWAQHDPKSALDAVSKEENWNTRRTLQIDVVSMWAFNEPIELLNRLEELPSGIVEQAQIRAFRRLANNSPETASHLFERIKTRELKTTIAKEFAKTWMAHDLEAALRWAKSDPNVSDIRREVIASVLRRLSQDDPKLAVQQALREPVTDGESGIESDVIFEIARRNVDQAIQLLPLARNDTTRSLAYRWVGIELINDGESKTAIDLSNELSEPCRTQYLRHIFARLALVNPSELLSRIDLLASEQIRSNVADSLLSNDQVRNNFSKDQIEELKTHQH
jgi:hypothetical protein